MWHSSWHVLQRSLRSPRSPLFVSGLSARLRFLRSGQSLAQGARIGTPGEFRHRNVPVSVCLTQLVTPRHGGRIDQQPPTSVRPLRATIAHRSEHSPDCFVRKAQPFTFLQQEHVSSFAEARFTTDSYGGAPVSAVNNRPNRGVQCLVPRVKRLPCHWIMFRFYVFEQKPSVELAANQRRCQATQKISRSWTKLFSTLDQCGADRIVRIKPES
jgi:hypothetical protein